jgi:hypothetical protein
MTLPVLATIHRFIGAGPLKSSGLFGARVLLEG